MVGRIPRLLGVWWLAMSGARLGEAQALHPSRWLATTTPPPASYGTQDYTVTKISALSFSGETYVPAAPLSRASNPNVEQHFYATLDIPNGAVIDYIGINNANDGTPNVLAIHLWDRETGGATFDLFDLDNTPHTFLATDINGGALDLQWTFGRYDILVLDIEVAPSPNAQYLGWVEVWWRRIVTPAPAESDFNDVPTSHPFFQYIEALKASGITGGCQASPPLYCPDNPVTRGQMAVFLAKALGLHWPY
jgi:hypothetical protein